MIGQGYSVCKAGGSLGVWDLIAIGPYGNKLVQVKSNRPPGRAERLRMLEFKVSTYTTKWLAVWHDRAKEPVWTEIS